MNDDRTSETALMVAAYRARASQRPGAVCGRRGAYFLMRFKAFARRKL